MRVKPRRGFVAGKWHRLGGVVSETHACALALLLSILLSSAAFLLPSSVLWVLVTINAGLIAHGLLLKKKIAVLLRLAAVQFVTTMGLYSLFHGESQLLEGAIVVLRVLLAMLPGWWLSSTQRPERLGEVLSWGLPHQWAFVIAASLSLLPFMSRELQEIYQIQCMRGARITPKALRNPKNWPEFIYCVLFPLLIQLLKLSKQMAISAKLRHFGDAAKATHWPSTRDHK
ncbi:energy-coupling factor transporter transmembrane protein EcfT [Shewanella abyssi]|uniref:energy-coupling factor transporter transmembrane component T n=1 Tax=Shewanella abyssi TaxID=311789 RepID=UPI00200E1CA1|nr:energy-coupling factor transporter transmembrane component T [Shewanella abyssi]MCL1051296.1 energy-coupling factor transporter transmembrane protein EcfT [Shewanella abyssi]